MFMKSIGAVQNPDEPIELPRQLAFERSRLRMRAGRGHRPDLQERAARAGARLRVGLHLRQRRQLPAIGKASGAAANGAAARRSTRSARSARRWSRPTTFPIPNTLAIKTILNGQAVQDWNTNDMIFDVPTLIEFLSGSTTLLAGTVILTGTPHGVGVARKPQLWLKAGDTITIEIDKIGSLTNPVVEEKV